MIEAEMDGPADIPWHERTVPGLLPSFFRGTRYILDAFILVSFVLLVVDDWSRIPGAPSAQLYSLDTVACRALATASA